MATGLHAQNNGVNRRVLLQVSAVQTARLLFKLQASQFCAGSVVFIELSDTELHAQTRRVASSTSNPFKKRHNPILNSHPAKASGHIAAEVVKLRKEKKLQIPLLHPTKCSVDGWFSSNRSYENIDSTDVTARKVYKSVNQFPLVLGQKTVLKHVCETDTACLFQTKTTCTQHENTPLWISFSPLASFFLFSLNDWKQITDIYFGDTFFFLCLQFQKKCSFLPNVAAVAVWLNVQRAFSEIFAAVCSFFLKKETEMAPEAAVFQVLCVFNPLSNSQDFLLSSIGRSTLTPPRTSETFWWAVQ